MPDAVVNDTRAVTMEAESVDTLIPSLAPLAPPPVVVEPAPVDWNRWLMIGGLVLAVMWLANIKPGR